MVVFTQEIMAQLKANNRATEPDEGPRDSMPVVKVFTPDANAAWLFTELDWCDRLFGLCDLGMGCPELGYVNLPELMELRGQLGLPVERDTGFMARVPLSVYADHAMEEGSIAGAIRRVRRDMSAALDYVR